MGDVLHQSKKELNSLVQSGEFHGIKTILSSNILDENANLQHSRPILLFLSELLKDEMILCLNDNPDKPPHIEEESLIDLLNYILTKIVSHQMRSQFDESDSLCRELLFKYHISCGEYKIGAAILGEVQLDSVLNKYNSESKADILIRCAEAFLMDDDSTSAETMLTKAARSYMAEVNETASIQNAEAALARQGDTVSSVANETSSITLLILRYRVIKAKVDDANRKFIEAARQYHELSNISNNTIPISEKLELLGNAVTCAVLGKAGPQRSRVLGLLYKDDRLKDLSSLTLYRSHSSILIKMYTERLLNTSELTIFEECLKSHQKAMTSDGLSIIEKAVIEHNMQAAGKIYDNIKFTELSKILRLSVDETENVAAKMITEKRLKACIDQTENILIFESGSSEHNSDVLALQSWDSRIWDMCVDVTECIDSITTKYPSIIEAVDT
jgi:COP9 signalosome complex subunit 4